MRATVTTSARPTAPGEDRLELSFDAFNRFNWAAYTGFLSSDVRRPDRYPVEVNPQRPRAMQANVRYVF